MINLNKKFAVLGLSVMLAGPVLASDDKQVGEEIAKPTVPAAVPATTGPAAVPATTVAPVVAADAVEVPEPKYFSGKVFARVFGKRAAVAVGRSIFGIDYSKLNVEVGQSEKVVLDAFGQLPAEEQAKILQAIRARDLQSVLKTGEQPAEGVVPASPTPPPAPIAPPAPDMVAVKAPNRGLLDEIQKGTALKKTERPKNPEFDKSNTDVSSLAAAVTSRRGALEQSDDESGDDWSE